MASDLHRGCSGESIGQHRDCSLMKVRQMVENLRHHHRYHERTQQQALIGSNLPFVPDCGETNEDGSCQDDVPVQDFTIPEVMHGSWCRV